MVSFIEILKGLMGGKYATGTGYPGADRDFDEFVKEVVERVPGLRDRDDWEIEELVSEALDYAINNLCKPIDYKVKRSINHVEEAGILACYHPELGRFYIVFDEESDANAGVHKLSFMITRSEEEAREEWSWVREEWGERG